MGLLHFQEVVFERDREGLGAAELGASGGEGCLEGAQLGLEVLVGDAEESELIGELLVPRKKKLLQGVLLAFRGCAIRGFRREVSVNIVAGGEFDCLYCQSKISFCRE